MPPVEKYMSITTDPVIIPTNAGPRYETTGIKVGFIAWRQMIARSDRPLARAVRIKFEFRTSSIDERVIRAMDAKNEVDSAMTGIIRYCHWPPFQPPPGKRPSLRVKT